MEYDTVRTLFRGSGALKSQPSPIVELSFTHNGDVPGSQATQPDETGGAARDQFEKTALKGHKTRTSTCRMLPLSVDQIA